MPPLYSTGKSACSQLSEARSQKPEARSKKKVPFRWTSVFWFLTIVSEPFWLLIIVSEPFWLLTVTIEEGA
jgi:hypothetical protein